MKSLLPLSLIAAIALTTGCAYNGTLKTGFYEPPTNNKMPLKVNLVCGDFFRSIVIDPGHIYGHYSVHIKTDPALREAIAKSCESLFEKVQVSITTDPGNQLAADIVILPPLELTEHTLTLTLAIKSAYSGEMIQQFSASNNFEPHAPAGVDVLDTLDIFACGGLAPVIIPANTSMIGHRGEADLEKSLFFCLGQIVENLRNDTDLVAKVRAIHKA